MAQDPRIDISVLGLPLVERHEQILERAGSVMPDPRDILTRRSPPPCVMGAGLISTWQAGKVSPVTIDHILVERGVGVRAVRAHRVGGSDHSAVAADLVVPR